MAPPAEPEPVAEAEEEAAAKASDALTPATVKALRDAKKALDEGKMSEEDFKAMKAGLLGKQTPAAEAPAKAVKLFREAAELGDAGRVWAVLKGWEEARGRRNRKLRVSGLCFDGSVGTGSLL